MKTMKKIAVLCDSSRNRDLSHYGPHHPISQRRFLFRGLAPIFGVLAAIMRFGTASLMKILAQPYTMKRPNKRKVLPGKMLNKRTGFSGKSLEKHLSDRLYGKIEGRILVWRVKIQ